MTQSLGEYLRETRTRQGVTLEAIAERTRISPSHLRALEENDFSKLPALLFARAYVKAYSRCLALQESQQADIMLRFAEIAGEYYGRQDTAGEEQENKTNWAGRFRLVR